MSKQITSLSSYNILGMKEVQMLMVGGEFVLFSFLRFSCRQMFHIRGHSVRRNIYDEIYFRKVKNMYCTDCNSAIYGLYHRKCLKQVPKICCLEKNILAKRSTVYRSFNNKVGILPKKELTLVLAEKPPWWKLLFQ